MTATMLDIITGALKRLRVVNPRKTISSVASADGLTALNDMMQSWRAHGVDTDHPEGLELNDEFPLDVEHVQGVKALLALRLAGEYGLQVPADVTHDAAHGWAALQSEFVKSATEAVLDPGLTQTLGGRWWA